MRIEKPYTHEDRRSKVFLDDQDVTRLALSCDDEEGWVDVLVVCQISSTKLTVLLDKSGRDPKPIVHRAHGTVRIVRPETP